MDTSFISLVDQNIHTEKIINMSVSKINGLEEKRLIKIKVETVKAKTDLAMTQKTPSLFLVW